MKKILFVIGVILTIYSLLTIVPYIFNDAHLSKYGKGFIVGRTLILFFGIVLIVIGKRKESDIKL